MKKNLAVLFALTSVVTVVALKGECSGKPQVVTTQRSASAAITLVDLSAEELSVAAKLNDDLRRSFTDRLTTEQRSQVMVAIDNGTSPDEAVQRLLEARERANSNAIASNEEELNDSEIDE